MENLLIAVIAGLLILLASVASVELGVSVALIEISFGVVAGVLVETGLTLTPLGKLIMACTFVTDFGTALALALLFVRPTWWLVPFLGVSVLVIWAMLTLQPWFFSRYGERVIEPEIKGAVAALLVLMFFAERSEERRVGSRWTCSASG